MPDFNQRLAELADQVRKLDGGIELGRSLVALAADVDGYLEQQRTRRDAAAMGLFQKWSEFMNTSVAEAHAYGDQRLATERRRLAQRLAADPRWSGGYADALKLLEQD
jgi:hypothetical protein